MSVNVDGMFLMAEAVGGQMQKQGIAGSIIQTSSIYGIVSSDKRIYEGSLLSRPPDQQPGSVFNFQSRGCRTDLLPRGELGEMWGFGSTRWYQRA